jgi:tetratricopeptide (TPR) repeat protein
VRCASSLAVVVTLLAGTAPAIADTASAEAAFERGRTLLKAGNTREACAAFQASLDDEFQYGTLYNLAGCHDKLGNLASAWRMYTRLAEEDTNQGRRDRSREVAAKLWQRVPKLIVDIAQPPAGLAVRVDGDNIAAKLARPIAVDPGDHVVIATASGFREWRTTVNVEAASAELRVVIELARADAPQREQAQPAVTEYRRERKGHRTAAKAFLIGAPVGVGTSLAIGYWGKLRYDEALRDGELGTISPAESARRANHYVMINRWVATPFAVAGFASLAVGLVLYVRSSTVVLTPIASSQSAGLSFTRSF